MLSRIADKRAIVALYWAYKNKQVGSTQLPQKLITTSMPHSSITQRMTTMQKTQAISIEMRGLKLPLAYTRDSRIIKVLTMTAITTQMQITR